MLLSNPQLKYKNEAGEWIKLEDLYACDINVSSRPGRTNEVTTGLYTNEFVDNCRITFKQGSNGEFDKLTNGDETEVRIWDGTKWIQCTCNVASKYNKKIDYQSKITLLTLSMNSLVEQTYIIPGGSGSAAWGSITGDIQDQTDLQAVINSFTKEVEALNIYCDNLDATKLDVISYIELSGKSGTLTDEQRATLLSGSPTLNFIDKDGMIFKCVFYSAGKKAVYSIAGESKIHVITVTLPAGTWALTTYNLQPTLTAGDGITIKNNVISATGGSGGGVSQDYVDTQDQAILATATERVDEEGVERANMDATLTEGLLQESEKRSQSFSTLSAALTNETTNRTEADNQLQTNIDNEIVARTEEDVKLQANIEEEATTRQAVDEKLLTAVNNKQDILTAGTNITIVDNVISASGGGSATSFISLRGTSGTVTTDQLKVLGANFANYILVMGTDDTTRRFTFVQEPFPSMDLHYVCINQNKVDLLTIVQGNNKWSITDGSELAKQSDLEAVDAKLGEDENGIYVDL